MHPSRFTLLFLFLSATSAMPLKAEVEETRYDNRPAFRISDGKTEAVVVPELAGRLMRYGAVGGPNWIWNAESRPRPEGWSNVGGDKTFIGPHPAWGQFIPSIWPPTKASWDVTPHRAEKLSNDHLRTTSPVWEGFGARVVREYWFEPNGELVIQQTLEQVEGTSPKVAVWNVTQIPPPEGVYFIPDSSAARPGGFHPISEMPAEPKIERVRPGLLRIQPTTGKSYKIGADSPAVAIAAIKDGTAFLQRSVNPPAPMEDGSGFPVEFYNHREGGAAQYVELELLSEKRALQPGEKLTQTLHWSLHPLPSGEGSLAGVEVLLRSKAVSSPTGR